MNNIVENIVHDNRSFSEIQDKRFNNTGSIILKE